MTGLLLALGCQVEARFECERDQHCDQGEICANGDCKPQPPECTLDDGCPVGSRCAQINSTRRCLDENGACGSHQDCPVGALCNDLQSCSYADAFQLAQVAIGRDGNEDLDSVARKAETASCVGAEATHQFEFTWNGVVEEDTDLLVMYLFRRPPITVDGRIVNFSEAAVASDATDSPSQSGSTRYARMRLNEGDTPGRLSPGRYYWFARGFRDGQLVSASPIWTLDVLEDGSGCAVQEAEACSALCFEGDGCSGTCAYAQSTAYPSALLVCAEEVCTRVCASDRDCAVGESSSSAEETCDFDRDLGPPGSGLCAPSG